MYGWPSSIFSIAVIKTRQATWGGKGLFLLTVCHQGKPGQGPGAETEVETMEGAAHCLAFNHLSYTQGWHQTQWSFLYQLAIKKMPKTSFQAILLEAVPYLRLPLPRFVKV